MKIPMTILEQNELKAEKINEIVNCLYEITEIQKIVKGENLVNTKRYLFKQFKKLMENKI